MRVLSAARRRAALSVLVSSMVAVVVAIVTPGTAQAWDGGYGNVADSIPCYQGYRGGFMNPPGQPSLAMCAIPSVVNTVSGDIVPWAQFVGPVDYWSGNYVDPDGRTFVRPIEFNSVARMCGMRSSEGIATGDCYWPVVFPRR